MHAWTLSDGVGVEHLQWIERPSIAPGPREVRIRIRAVALNYRDLLIVKGLYNPRLPLPRVIGSDGAGDIIAVGSEVDRWKVGDRVVGSFMQGWIDGALTDIKTRTALGGERDGVFATEVVLDQDGIVATPDHLSDPEAATLPCAAVTAWHALSQANLHPGDVVLLQGTGGVSIFALQFAKLFGARVLMISSSDAKRDRARELGADETTNYRSDPAWDKWVREKTNGVGADHIIEVGGAGTLERSMRAVRTGGTISLIGILSGGSGTVNPLPLLMRTINLRGIFVGSRKMFEDMNRAIAYHRLRPVIDRTFRSSEMIPALQHLENGSHFGKIVIQMDS